MSRFSKEGGKKNEKLKPNDPSTAANDEEGEDLQSRGAIRKDPNRRYAAVPLPKAPSAQLAKKIFEPMPYQCSK